MIRSFLLITRFQHIFITGNSLSHIYLYHALHTLRRFEGENLQI